MKTDLTIPKAFDVLTIFLRHGKENPVKGEEISELTGVSTRTVAEIAKLAQERGIGVCSGAHGYFHAKNRQEFDEHLEKEHRRAMAVLEKVSEAKKRDLHQVSLFEKVA